MRKKAILLFISLLITAAIVFHKPLLTGFFEWYLQGYCKEYLQGNLQYERLQLENGIWVLDFPKINAERSLKQGGYQFSADQASLIPEIDWWKREITFHASFVSPHLDVGESGALLKDILDTPRGSFLFFAVHAKISVPHGNVVLHDFSSETPQNIPLSFQLDLCCRNSWEGTLAAWFTDQNFDKNHISITFSHAESEQKMARLVCHNFDAARAVDALRLWSPKYRNWKIYDGILEGKISLHFTADGVQKADGDAFLHNVNFANTLLQLKGSIPEAHLQFMENKSNTQEKDSSFIGHLDFPKSSTLTLFKEEEPFWLLEQLSGTVFFKTSGSGKLILDGLCRHHKKVRNLHMEGNLRSPNETYASMDFKIALKGENGPDFFSHFAIRQIEGQWNMAEVELTHLGHEEFEIFQTVVGYYYPIWNQLHMRDGALDAVLFVFSQGLNLTDVKIEKISGRNLSFEIDPWSVSAKAERLEGNLNLNLTAADILSTLHADVSITEGNLSLSSNRDTNWQFTDIHTHLKVRRGAVQNSLIKGAFAGMTGSVEVNWEDPLQALKIDFQGKANDLVKLFPEQIKQGINLPFGSDQLILTAEAAKESTGLVFKGLAQIKEQALCHNVDFGFGIEKNLIGSFTEWSPVESIQHLLPAFEHSDSSESFWLHDVLKAAGLLFTKGWFEVNDLPLEKFVSPLLFMKNQMKLSGLGDFQGLFDLQEMALRYNFKDFILENKNFAIEGKRFGDEKPQDIKLPAAHYFQLGKKESFGSIPLYAATYFDKNTGLLFTDVEAQVRLEEGQICMPALETYCNGIFFAGAIDINWRMPGEGIFTLDIYSHILNGKVSQVQHFLSHFDKPFFFLKIPLEGLVSLNQDGTSMHYIFQKDDYQLQTRIQGMITDGVMDYQGADISLRELCFNFDFNQKENSLEINDIQGTFLVGDPEHVEEYFLAGERVQFTNYNDLEANFDLWIGDRKRDVIRLAGKTEMHKTANQPPLLHVDLDKSLSHFGDVHPKIFQLVLKENSQVEDFHLQFDFNLATFFHDLQRFSRTGLFLHSKRILKEVNNLKRADGIFKVNLQYDGEEALLAYDLVGKDVEFGQHHFQQVMLNGKKKDSTWMIDQLLVDQYSLAADLLHEGDAWKVNFLGLRAGNSVLLGLEGKYLSDKNVFDGQINLLEVDLARLDEWPSFKRVWDDAKPGGQIKAFGPLHIKLGKNKFEHQIEASLTTSLRSGQFRGLYFTDIEKTVITFTSDKEISINSLQTSLKSGQDGSIQADLFMPKGHLDLVKQQLELDELNFQIPHKNLTWLAENLQQSFPDAITQPVADIIQAAKKEGYLEGKLKIEYSPPYHGVQLKLADGQYHFLNKDHNLRNFVLDCSPFECKCITQYHYEQHLFWLLSRFHPLQFDKGEIIFSDFPLDPSSETYPSALSVHWLKDPILGFSIQSARGNFSGIAMDLMRDPEYADSAESYALQGVVDLNLSQMTPLLKKELADAIHEWNLSHGWKLNGKWVIARDESRDFFEKTFFSGELYGDDFEFHGYRFQKFTSAISLNSQSIFLENIYCIDPCGSLQAMKMEVIKNPNGHWIFSIPQLHVEKFRPSLLQSVDSPTVAPKPLIIQEIAVQNVKGVVGYKDSIIGTGTLTFANPPKKNLQNTIFAIPAEILTRIGLDLSVLNPVTGTINYEIKNGKVFFNQFKDIYSAGRMSKFYLPNEDKDSYVDFKGNLHVRVRMKQYNLLFKLAELFTVTIQGNLKKPTYSLQKQG